MVKSDLLAYLDRTLVTNGVLVYLGVADPPLIRSLANLHASKIVVLEPDPNRARLLEEHAANLRLEVCRAVIGKSDSHTKFYSYSHPVANGLDDASMVTQKYPGVELVNVEQIATRTVESILSEFGRNSTDRDYVVLGSDGPAASLLEATKATSVAVGWRIVFEDRFDRTTMDEYQRELRASGFRLRLSEFERSAGTAAFEMPEMNRENDEEAEVQASANVREELKAALARSEFEHSKLLDCRHAAGKRTQTIEELRIRLESKNYLLREVEESRKLLAKQNGELRSLNLEIESRYGVLNNYLKATEENVIGLEAQVLAVEKALEHGLGSAHVAIDSPVEQSKGTKTDG